MTTPQKENGYTAIANEIMDAMVKYRIPGEQMQCLLFILRKTYGFNKKSDKISLSQFVKGTGIKRRAVARAIKALQDKNIIFVKKGGAKKDTIIVSEYTFNKRFKSWKSSVKKDTGSVKIDRKVVSKKTHTKDNITKDSDILSYITPDNSEFCHNFINYIQKTKAALAPTGSDLLKKSADTVDKLIRLDGFTLDYVKQVLWFAINDDFWSDNVLSLSGLRRKTDGLSKFQKIANSFEKSKKKKINGNSRSEQNAKACHDFIYGGNDE